jgi:membrane dipeptidase
MKEGGVTAANVTIASSQHLGGACLVISDWFNLLKSVDDATLILKAKDIKKAKENGNQGIIFGFQNTTPLETGQNVSEMFKCWGSLELFYKLGVRIIQLTYSRRARTGDGCYEITDCGLSRSGIDVIEGMNELGVLLDLSHCGPRTTLEAIEASKDPVAFTHSGARAINDFVRIKRDDEIQALAEKNGVIGIIAESNFIKHKGGLRENQATLENLLDHIDYINNLVGINHIGIGGDIPEVARGPERIETGRVRAIKQFEEVDRDKKRYPNIWYHTFTFFDTMFVKGFETMGETLNITKGLIARGYSDKEIIKIQGGNFLKLFEKVWK